MKYEHILKKYSIATKVDVFLEMHGHSLRGMWRDETDNPVTANAELYAKLKAGADGKEMPYLYRDDFGVFFASIRFDEGYLFLGPMCSRRLSSVETRQFYRSYHVRTEDVHSLYSYSFLEILSIVELLAETITGEPYESARLLAANGLGKQEPLLAVKEEAVLEFHEDEQNEDEDTYRHTYAEERRLLKAVSTGDTETAVSLNRQMDSDTGRLSKKDTGHWRNLAIVGITLCARAAIEGGLSPRVAYQVSGYYINKCDSAQHATQLIAIREQAVREFSERVKQRQDTKPVSVYSKRCRDYVEKHYREKIYLEDIAETLGVSPTYLSRLFKKEMGISLQDYVNQVRVGRACNLLRYSDESLSRIAEYVHFPSQSYFGRIFKLQMNMTPREYRNLYQAEEWTE